MYSCAMIEGPRPRPHRISWNCFSDSLTVVVVTSTVVQCVDYRSARNNFGTSRNNSGSEIAPSARDKVSSRCVVVTFVDVAVIDVGALKLVGGVSECVTAEGDDAPKGGGAVVVQRERAL